MIPIKERYFVKSLEEDFATKTLKGKKKVSCQSINNIIKTKTLKPNTNSFGRQKRLACTLLTKKYLKTYRPQGIIFQTSAQPDHVAPFDIVLLTNAKKIVVEYYRIKDNLHVYYNHELMSGHEEFIFKDIKSMLRRFSSPKKAWRKVNKFRKKAGYEKLPKTKYKLVEYNEIIFHKPIKIKPVAVYGYKKEAKEVAKKHNLLYFKSAKGFYKDK